MIDRTVFRLPLRTGAQAGKNRISTCDYTIEQYESLLQDIAASGGSLLLFLRHVQDIEARTIHPDGTEVIWSDIRTTNRCDVEPPRKRVAANCAGSAEDVIKRSASHSVEEVQQVRTEQSKVPSYMAAKGLLTGASSASC